MATKEGPLGDNHWVFLKRLQVSSALHPEVPAGEGWVVMNKGCANGEAFDTIEAKKKSP